MTRDFDQVRAVAGQSLAGRTLRSAVAIVGAAWATAIVGRTARAVRRRFAAAPPGQQLRWWATVFAIAATVHLMFRAFMAATVVPALPAPLVLAFAATMVITAWQAEAVHRAWRQSRLARLFDRQI